MKLREFDWILFGIVLVLIAVGLITVASTAYDIRTDSYRGFLVRQLCWAVLGVGVFLCAHLVSYKKLERWAYVLYAGGIVLLLLVFLMPAIKGSRRWFTLGPLAFQPSETMKLFLIIALARYLKYRDPIKRMSELVPALVLTGVPLFLIARQPDLGTSLTLLPVLGAMLYVGGARMKHLLTFALIGAMLVPVGYLLLKPYQRERLHTFFAKDKLSRQQRLDQAYQSIQAEIAVGSGGVFGKGWRQGTQNLYRFVPDRHNDFIFCVFAEEWGFAGGVVLLGLYGLLLLCCLGVAQLARDPFGQLLAVGVTALIATQVFVHVAINVQLFPVTGLTLPLISSGGTSLVTCMLSLALVSNVRLWWMG